MRKSFDLSVYFIADPSVCGGRDICDVVKAALDGGASMIQYRDKSGEEAQVWRNAARILAAVQAYGAPFLLNDYVEIAKEIGADGVHVGQGDMNAAEVRDIMGDDAIVGVTAYTPEHIMAIDPGVVDYIGTGPFYATKTKPDKPVLGEQGFADLVALSPVPVVGIGGIEIENAAAVMEAGADGVAMMRAVSEAQDVAAAARGFVQVAKA